MGYDEIVPKAVETDYFETWARDRRDRAREDALPPECHALLRMWIIAHARLAKVRRFSSMANWNTFYTFLESSPDDAEMDELSKEISEMETETVRLRQSAKANRADQKYERQAEHVEPRMSHATREKKLRGKCVWLYHGTSSALLDRIVRDGLRPDQTPIDKSTTTSGYVYLTAEPGSWQSGGTAAFYARRAAYRHGGEPMILRVIVDFDDLEPDDDDADLSSYNAQFRTATTVPVGAIMEADGERLRERYSGSA